MQGRISKKMRGGSKGDQGHRSGGWVQRVRRHRIRKRALEISRRGKRRGKRRRIEKRITETKQSTKSKDTQPSHEIHSIQNMEGKRRRRGKTPDTKLTSGLGEMLVVTERQNTVRYFVLHCSPEKDRLCQDKGEKKKI
jgi:hypothetical protein